MRCHFNLISLARSAVFVQSHNASAGIAHNGGRRRKMDRAEEKVLLWRVHFAQKPLGYASDDHLEKNAYVFE